MLRCLLAGAGLIGGFLAIVAWFGVVDVWHTDFFAAGPLTAVNNLARIGFILILAWLIYAPGAASRHWWCRQRRRPLTPLERAVTGFGIGIGLW